MALVLENMNSFNISFEEESKRGFVYKKNHFSYYKYEELLKKHKKEVEMNFRNKKTIENLKAILSDLRSNYFRDIIHNKEINFRSGIPSKKVLQLDVSYFSLSDTLDKETANILNYKLSKVKESYEYNLHILTNQIEELHASLNEANERIEFYKNNLSEENLLTLMERLKAATKTPQKAWRCIKKVFGIDLIKTFVFDEIGEIKVNLNYLNNQFLALEEKMDKQITIVKNEFKKEIEVIKKQKNKEPELIIKSFIENVANLNERISKLEEEKTNLSNELSLRGELVNNIGDTIIKNTNFTNPLKQEIFTILAERLKCNTLIKVNNNLIDLVKTEKKVFISYKVQVDQRDFNIYLQSNNSIVDKSVQINSQSKRIIQENNKISHDYDYEAEPEISFSEELLPKSKIYRIPKRYTRLNYEMAQLEKKFKSQFKFKSLSKFSRKNSLLNSKSKNQKIDQKHLESLKRNSLKNVQTSTSNSNSDFNYFKKNQKGTGKLNVTLLNINPNNTEEILPKHKLNFSFLHLNKETNTYEFLKKNIDHSNFNFNFNFNYNVNPKDVDKKESFSLTKNKNKNLTTKRNELNQNPPSSEDILNQDSVDYCPMPYTLLHKNSIVNSFNIKRISMNNSTKSKQQNSERLLKISKSIIKSISP